MKKAIFISFLALFAAQLSAQRFDNRDETLFNRSQRSGFFVSPIIEYSNFDKDWTTATGGGLAFISGDLFFGAYGMGMTNLNHIVKGGFNRLDMGHGGFWIGYVLPQHKVLHLFTSIKAGWGALDIDFDGKPHYKDSFFAVTPEAGLEVNVFRWLRLAGTVGYRFMNGLNDSAGFDKNDFQTTTGSLTIRVGGFGRSSHSRVNTGSN